MPPPSDNKPLQPTRAAESKDNGNRRVAARYGRPAGWQEEIGANRPSEGAVFPRTEVTFVEWIRKVQSKRFIVTWPPKMLASAS